MAPEEAAWTGGERIANERNPSMSGRYFRCVAALVGIDHWRGSKGALPALVRLPSGGSE